MKKKLSILLALLLVISGINFEAFKVSAIYDFTLIFDLNGGGPQIESKIVKLVDDPHYAKIYIPAQDPVRKGYKFLGWKILNSDSSYDNGKDSRLINFTTVEGQSKVMKFLTIDNECWELEADDGKDDIFVHYMVNQDNTLTIKAIWGKMPQLSVKIDNNGGVPAEETYILDINDKLKAPATQATREGYTLKGYKCPKGHIVRFDGNETVDYTYIEELGRTGWYFNHLDDMIYDVVKNKNADGLTELVITAEWEKEEAKTYTVKFNPMGGSPKPADQKVTAGGHAKTPTTIPTKDGMVFDGWYYKDTKIDFNTEVITRDIEYEAHYKKADAKTCTVKFNPMGGSPKPADQKVTAGGHAKTPSEVPKKDGMVFDGWYYKDTKIDFNTEVITRDIEYEAHYKKASAKTVTVRFETAGGTPKPAEQQVVVGEKVTKPSTDPVKAGQNFISWNSIEGEYNFDSPVERDMILYANYSDGKTYNRRRRPDILISDDDYDKAIIQYPKAYVKGYPGEIFKPENTITRAEMATIFARLLNLEGKTPAGKINFTDLNGHWAKNNILLVAEYGLINGYPNKTFKPDGKMKRGEIAKIIAKYWEIKGFTPDATEPNIQDIKNHWAKTVITSLYNHRFVDLYADGSFRPEFPLKRADVAQILNRITDRPLRKGYADEKFKDVPKSHWAFKEVDAASSDMEE